MRDQLTIDVYRDDDDSWVARLSAAPGIAVRGQGVAYVLHTMGAIIERLTQELEDSVALNTPEPDDEVLRAVVEAFGGTLVEEGEARR